jgi:hypothetical protein
MNPTPRKCKGHVKVWLRNSRLRKGKNREELLQEPVIRDDGKCAICGGIINESIKS